MTVGVLRLAAPGLALLVATAGCSTAVQPPPPGAVSVVIDAHPVWVVRDRALGEIVLTSTRPDGGNVGTSFIDSGRRGVVHFSGFDWPDRQIADAYLYGVAPAGAASLETSPPGTSAVGPDGLFVAVVPRSADAPPSSFHWRFLDANGQVVAEGDGQTE